MIVLRPHHLLCTQGYSGHGYDDAFVEHMNDVVHQLREVPGTRIHLTFSTDTLCSCCPNSNVYRKIDPQASAEALNKLREINPDRKSVV